MGNTGPRYQRLYKASQSEPHPCPACGKTVITFLTRNKLPEDFNPPIVVEAEDNEWIVIETHRTVPHYSTCKYAHIRRGSTDRYPDGGGEPGSDAYEPSLFDVIVKKKKKDEE